MTYYSNIYSKTIRIHRRVEKEIESIDVFTRSKIAEAFVLLAKGESLGMPLSRPMPTVEKGSHELRIKSSRGQWRVFYFLKLKHEILVFHIFQKKTQKTPQREIETAKQRLKEML